MMRALGAVLALALAILPACASTGGTGDGDGPTGCYQFYADADARALGLPWGVELLEADLENAPSNLPGARLAVTRLTATTRADHPFGYWRRLENGALQVGYPGMGSTSLELRLEGVDLIGTGRSVGDAVPFGEPPPSRDPRPVTAYRVLCPPASGGAG